MTDEHVWVTIGGKRLYVGKALPESIRPLPEGTYFDENTAQIKAKPKRRRAPYTPPQEIFDVETKDGRDA